MIFQLATINYLDYKPSVPYGKSKVKNSMNQKLT